MANDSYNTSSKGVIAAGRAITAATSVTVTDTVYQRIYQRVGTSKTVTVSGTYSGPAQLIQARSCPVGTATNALEATYPWSNLDNGPTGGTFSGSLSVPQGDNWVVQARCGKNPAVASSGTHAFGVGIFVAMLGQSNMENMFSSIYGWPLGSPSALVKSATTGGIIRLGAIKDTYPPSSLSATYGSWDSPGSASARDHGNGLVIMANDLVAAFGCPVLMLTYAASGTSSSQWQPGQTYMATFLAGLDAVGGDCEAVIWLQGGNDAASSVSAATYQGNLQNIFNTIKSHTGRGSSNFHFGVVVVGPGLTTSGAWGAAWSAEGTLGPIRKGQLDFVAANTANGAFLAGTDIDGNLAGASPIHIDQASLFRQGRRYTEAIKRRLTGAGNNIEGPRVTGATRSGNVVTVSIAQAGGTALQDGAGGSGGSLQGFRVFDAGTPVSIIATAIAGNTVQLTLASTPTGAVTLDYAMANAPFGSTTSTAAVLYDNQTIPGDSLGLPLQPCPLITVT